MARLNYPRSDSYQRLAKSICHAEEIGYVHSKHTSQFKTHEPVKLKQASMPTKEQKNDAMVKQLLQDVEDLNGLRDQVVLEKIMDGPMKKFYGKKGSPIRRFLQIRWCNYKRQSIQGYLKTLEKYDVEPSRKTKLLYKSWLQGTEETKKVDEAEKGDKEAKKAEKAALKDAENEVEAKPNDKGKDDKVDVKAENHVNEENKAPKIDPDVSKDADKKQTASKNENKNNDKIDVPEVEEVDDLVLDISDDEDLYEDEDDKDNEEEIYEEEIYEEEDTNKVDKITETFKKTTIKEPETMPKPEATVTPNKKTPVKTPVKTPIKTPMKSPTPRACGSLPKPFGLPKQEDDTETTEDTSLKSKDSNEEEVDVAFHVASLFSDQNEEDFEGSEKNPYISPVFIKYPERNRDATVQKVNEMERKGWSRPGYHLSMQVHMLDYKLYTMRIPNDAEFAQYKGHCVLLKRPSRSWCQRDLEAYQKKITCSATKKAMDAREIAISGDEEPARKWTYILFVFEEEIHNNHFGHGLEVERHFNGMKLGSNHNGNTFKKDIRAGEIYFEIACKNGGYPLKKTESAVKDED